MKTIPLLAIFACMLSIAAFSQPVCGFDNIHRQKMQNDAGYKLAVDENEKTIQRFIAKNRQRLSSRTTGLSSVLYTIPVVVHVMHTGGGVGTLYNPSDAQIQDAINYLNQVYNGTYTGTEGIGNMQLQFALATRDPNCNGTSGINRVNASSVAGYVENGISTNPGTTPGVSELAIKNLSRWSTSHYYNLWIVNKIDGKDGTAGTFTAGYAYFPGVPATYDGTVMLATQTAVGKSTLPHEMGHAFGLYHTFQGSSNKTSCPVNNNCNTDGDFVCDTEPVTYNYDTLTRSFDFSCRTGTNACMSMPYSINTEKNYMSYTTCNTLFTAGQKARVLAFAASTYRKSLTTSPGLGPALSFSFSPPVAASCSPVTSATGRSGNYAGILNIELNNRNMGSSTASMDNGYINGTNSCLNLIQLTAGSTYTLAVSVLDANEEQLKAWIDYNNDGSFDDATEMIHADASITSGLSSGSFTIPASAVQNTMLRMRVMDDVSAVYGVPAISNACFNPRFGQAEDYPVYIMSGTLPVTLLRFEGVLTGNAAILSWKTDVAQGLKYFDVEKSTDGKNFKKIGEVQAGNQTRSGEYSYTDVSLAENNFYRVRIREEGGAGKLSQVVVVRFDGLKQRVSIVNNPFQGYLDLAVDKPAARANFQLVSTSGMLVAEKTVFSPREKIRWNLPENLSKGVYILKVLVDGGHFTYKVVKQ